MAYEVIILGHLHMPLYFLGTFTEYPYLTPISFRTTILTASSTGLLNYREVGNSMLGSRSQAEVLSLRLFFSVSVKY